MHLNLTCLFITYLFSFSLIYLFVYHLSIIKSYIYIYIYGGTYKYQKTTQKLTKAFERFLRILLQLCRSRFRLIISEQKFGCKSQGTGVEKELFRTQSGIQTKYGGVQPSPF